MRVSALLTLCTLALGLVAGAGCGGSGSDDFELGFKREQRAIERLRSEISDAVAKAENTSDADLERQFGRLADNVQSELRDIERLKPTDKVKSDFRRLTTGLGDVRRDLVRISDAARRHDATGAGKAAADLGGHGNKVDHALASIAKALGIKAPRRTRGPSASDTGGTVSVTYAEPASEDEAFAKEILDKGGTGGVGDGFAKRFKLPADLKISVTGGDKSPFYDPSTKTVNLTYGFVNYTGQILRRSDPKMSDEAFGEELAAVDGFILVHEFAHAFIDVFDLPITGREEDAADQLATIFMTEYVDGGEEYAFDAASFFHSLADDPSALKESDFWNEHSLDSQRAYDIVCLIAGSSQKAFNSIKEQQILGEERLVRCPGEYQQKVSAWQRLLAPYIRN